MLNYRHLYYFWVVAKEGGFSRAADRLGMAIQTVSGQVRELEKALGHQLLKPAGRRVVLTEAGQAAFSKAEQIFELGQGIAEDVARVATGQRITLSVGLSDGLSKLAAHALLAPVLDTPHLRLVCHEGEFDQLLTELSLHQLDVVFAGQAVGSHANLRVSSQRIAVSPVEWYGPTALLRQVGRDSFPDCLASLPVLLPTKHSPLRQSLDRWFEQLGLRPQVVGEFEDSALLAVFAARGMGVFPVSELGAQDVGFMRGLKRLGRSEDLVEEIHLIQTRRGARHPLVIKLLAEVRGAPPGSGEA